MTVICEELQEFTAREVITEAGDGFWKGRQLCDQEQVLAAQISVCWPAQRNLQPER